MLILCHGRAERGEIVLMGEEVIGNEKRARRKEGFHSLPIPRVLLLGGIEEHDIERSRERLQDLVGATRDDRNDIGQTGLGDILPGFLHQTTVALDGRHFPSDRTNGRPEYYGRVPIGRTNFEHVLRAHQAREESQERGGIRVEVIVLPPCLLETFEHPLED